jgi:hypothetical protein
VIANVAAVVAFAAPHFFYVTSEFVLVESSTQKAQAVSSR